MRAIVLIAILALAGCNRNQQPQESEPAAPPPAAAKAAEGPAEAPMPREVLSCNCIYCGCLNKNFKGKPRECSCTKDKCLECGCTCGKAKQ